MRHLIVATIALFLLSSCKDDTNASLDLNFKLEYAGEPLVMLQDVTYPDGNIMQVKRVSFYLSDIVVTEKDGVSHQISEVEYIDLTDSHLNSADASQGFNYKINDTGTTDYTGLSFNIGLTDSQNNTVPEDYTSDNPLSKSSEYWRSWGSYIYCKLEGTMDYNENGISDSGEAFTLHLGTQDVKRTFTSAVSNSDESMDIVIDVEKIFNTTNGIYDIESKPRLHNLDDSTLEAMGFLADGIEEAISLR